VFAGKAGWSPGVFANGACFEASMPPRADLVIIDTMAVVDALSLERLIWRILQHFSGQRSRPAIVVYNPLHVIPTSTIDCNPANAFNSSVQYSWGLARPGAGSLMQHGEGEHNELARYYGIASLSHRDFLWSFLNTEAWRALDLSHGDCQLLRLVNQDWIHPSMLGRVLLADYVFAYLGAAIKRAGERAASSGGQTAEFPLPASAAQIAEFRRVAGGAALPKTPFQASGRDVYQMRCAGYFGREGREARRSADTSTSGALDVVGGDGFQFFLNTTNGSAKRKPGWVASTPGAHMDMAIDTWFASATTPEDAIGEVDVVLTYLRSYEHMGQADVSCLSGCTCSQAAVDAHSSERTSVAEVMALRVTPAARCVVRVRVRNETSSGEHKFKVVQLMARAIARQ
jgi:hypothetical protein